MKRIELKKLISLGFKTIGEAGKYRQQAKDNTHQIQNFMNTDKQCNK